MRRRAWGLAVLAALACGREHASPTTGPRTRVISQLVFADEVLWELGPEVRARVVAVSSMVDDPRYSAVAGRWPDHVARVAGTSEELVALAPDLVVVADFTATETRALLEQLGMPVLHLSGFDGFADHHRHVRALAEALDVSAHGEAAIAAFDERLASIRAHDQSAAAERPAIVSWQQGTVAGTGTIFADEADAAGFRLLPAEHGIVGHQSLALETLIAWDPAFVVIACHDGPDGCAEAEREFAATPGLAATRAAREGGVIAVPTHMLYSAGTGMLDVVERLAARRRGDA